MGVLTALRYSMQYQYLLIVLASAPLVNPRGSKNPRGADDPTKSIFIDNCILLDATRGAMKALALIDDLILMNVNC